MAARCPVSCGCRTRPNHQPSNTVFDSWHEMLVLICCLFFLPNTVLYVTKHLHSGLVWPKYTISEVLWFGQRQLYKPKPCCHVLLREDALFLVTLPNHPFLFSPFSNCTVMNFWEASVRSEPGANFLRCMSWIIFDLFLCRMIDFKLFERWFIPLPILIGSNTLFR